MRLVNLEAEVLVQCPNISNPKDNKGFLGIFILIQMCLIDLCPIVCRYQNESTLLKGLTGKRKEINNPQFI